MRLNFILMIFLTVSCSSAIMTAKNVPHVITESGRPLPQLEGTWNLVNDHFAGSCPEKIIVAFVDETLSGFDSKMKDVVRLAKNRFDKEPERLFAHEMIHLCNIKVSNGKSTFNEYRFIDEGYATLLAKKLTNPSGFSAYKMDLFSTSFDYLKKNKIHISELLDWKVYFGNPQNSTLLNWDAHTIGASFDLFLMESFGEQSVIKLFSSLSLNDFETSLKNVFHKTSDDIEHEWYDFIQKNFRSVGETLSKDRIKTDLDFVIHTLDSAYVGKYFIKDGSFHKSMKRLKEWRDKTIEQNALSFCYDLGQTLNLISDNHVHVRFGNSRCYKEEERLGLVGSNPASYSERWSLASRKTLGGKQVQVLSISTFNKGEVVDDPAWREFIKTSLILSKEPYFIVDLRGNDGGSDPVLAAWIKSLITSSQKFVLKNVTLQSPEVFDFFIQKYKSLLDKTKNTQEIKHYTEDLVGTQKQFELATDNKIPRFKKGIWSLSGNANTSYAGKVFVLQDGITMSCGEEMIEMLQTFFKVIKIGTHTGGSAHFGNVVFANLPESKLKMQFGTRYFPSSVFGFIEKKGITPDILLNKGDDALKRALEEIDKL